MQMHISSLQPKSTLSDNKVRELIAVKVLLATLLNITVVGEI
jgi:hypothetical protein